MEHVIMVVDDDADIRAALLDVFEDEGYRVLIACNGREALQKLHEATKTRAPCIIFLDLMMPVMDGVAFREEQLRSPELAGIPVVIFSAHRDAAGEAANLGAALLLKKPLDADELVGAAQRYCDHAA